MKFLADVNVSIRVVEHLRAQGLDIVRVPEIMDGRSPDDAILEEARRRGAIVITQDQDFTAILATTGATGPSLINIRVSYVDNERLTRAIVATIQATQEDLVAGAIATLGDMKVRVHRLPIA